MAYVEWRPSIDDCVESDCTDSHDLDDFAHEAEVVAKDAATTA